MELLMAFPARAPMKLVPPVTEGLEIVRFDMVAPLTTPKSPRQAEAPLSVSPLIVLLLPTRMPWKGWSSVPMGV